MVVRPESFCEAEDGIECTVEQVSYLGMKVDYTLKIGDQQIFASMDPKELKRPGDIIKVSIKDDAVWVVDYEPDPEPVIPDDEKKGIKGLLSKMKKKE